MPIKRKSDSLHARVTKQAKTAVAARQPLTEQKCPLGGTMSIIVWTKKNAWFDRIGHVSVALSDANGNPVYVCGLSPATLEDGSEIDPRRALLEGAPGKIYDDDQDMVRTHQMAVQHFPLTLEERANVDTAINQARRDPPRYGLTQDEERDLTQEQEHTCASWAVSIARVAGKTPNGVKQLYMGTLLPTVPQLMRLYSSAPHEKFKSTIKNLHDQATQRTGRGRALRTLFCPAANWREVRNRHQEGYQVYAIRNPPGSMTADAGIP